VAPMSAHEFFRDPSWLAAHGNRVEPHTADEYFTGAPWYDRVCLNEQWKAQGIVQPTDDVRRRCTGLEYQLVHCHPPLLYVFRKTKLEAGQDPIALASYYILDGTIFQAPTAQQVISSRLVRGALRMCYVCAPCDRQLRRQNVYTT
jgi:mediator of RNA polymerase II transcription subunit 6